MRPKSIRTFELLYVVSTVFGAASPILLTLNFDPASVALPTGAGPPNLAVFVAAAILVVLLFAVLIPLLLLYFATRRRAQWAAWAILIIGALCAIRLVFLLFRLTTVIGSSATGSTDWVAVPIGMLGGLLHMAALGFLLKPEARDWFKAKAEPPSAELPAA